MRAKEQSSWCGLMLIGSAEGRVVSDGETSHTFLVDEGSFIGQTEVFEQRAREATCVAEIQGCQDEWAENFEPNAVRRGGTCEHSCQSLEMNAGHEFDRCILRSEPESLQSLSLQESWPPCDGTSSGACVEGNTDLWVNRSYIAVGSGIGECRISSESDIGQEGIDFTSYEGDDAQTCQVRLCSSGYMCYGR